MLGYNDLNGCFYDGIHMATPYRHHKAVASWLVIVSGKKCDREILNVVAPTPLMAAETAIRQFPSYLEERKKVIKLLQTGGIKKSKGALKKKSAQK